ncbi:DUF2252 domain-containing protein [Arthrobacter sp. MSA 4-2]|uniref:DUF2252 domain-containing protein n=1 Tax=Arthrobacter sp. MSA 4-2 TaxID=2794349 RepID=UPI0018E75FE2|nr:DUF2252 domain-containing protein [Arthrobacter sp. MSA 4-2]MBJ2121227.1 DUF2252 domain-containing protein [Arthrobacter sp. MSA 4-2]
MVDSTRRQQLIIDTLVEAHEALMEADPHAFRARFRKMAADPYAFYRGSAALFYADMADLDDRWADERTSRVWIHGDLHAANFGTYMSNEGRLTFDVNDFDEAYVGHFSWDLRRFAASLALLCWQKALPTRAVHDLARVYLQAYLDRVRDYVRAEDADFAFGLANTDGAIRAVLQEARASKRTVLLDALTRIEDYERHFREDGSIRTLEEAEYRKVDAAFEEYLTTIPDSERSRRRVFYRVKGIVGKKGFGIGSAGLPAYNVLIEGFDEAQENDIILAMKQSNVAAPSRIVSDERVRSYFIDDGHRAVISQRSLQTHTDPFLGYTTIDGVSFVVGELSPYKRDLDWEDLTEPSQMEAVLASLGQATAKIHCASDEDSDHDLVPFRIETAIIELLEGREEEFIEDIIDFATAYAAEVRRDHSLFVDAFREGKITAVPAT